MNQHNPYTAAMTPEAEAESFHGDLRKGAYLKRRAAYQMQSSTQVVQQAGSLLPGPPGVTPRKAR